MILMKLLITQILTGLACLSLMLGNDWLAEGYGLHPLIAGAAAVVFIILPYIFELMLED